MTTAQPAYRMLSIFAEDPVLVGEPQLEWVPARRHLGISAFGTNAYRAGRAGEIVIEEHRESPGQEELYVVVRGSAEFTIGDEIFEAGAGMPASNDTTWRWLRCDVRSRSTQISAAESTRRTISPRCGSCPAGLTHSAKPPLPSSRRPALWLPGNRQTGRQCVSACRGKRQ